MGIYDTAGLGFFNYEYPLIRWLEKMGYYVTYATDVDIHRDPSLVANNKHKALLSNGHSEYWSWEMRYNIESARNRANNDSSKPLNLGFFGANISYWQVRFANSNSTGSKPANAPYRTMIAYKEYVDLQNNGDPYYQPSGNSLNYKSTTLWRNIQTLKPSGASYFPSGNYFQPEDEMVGIMTIPPEGDIDHEANSGNGYRPIFSVGSNNLEPSSIVPAWVIAGTGDEEVMPNMIGYESDELYPSHISSYSERSLSIIGSSPFYALRPLPGSSCECGSASCRCASVNLGDAETTFYKLLTNGAYSGGGKVFAASGQQWSWGLDNWGADAAYGPVSVRPASATFNASKISENVVNCLIGVSGACNSN